MAKDKITRFTDLKMKVLVLILIVLFCAIQCMAVPMYDDEHGELIKEGRFEIGANKRVFHKANYKFRRDEYYGYLYWEVPPTEKLYGKRKGVIKIQRGKIQSGSRRFSTYYEINATKTETYYIKRKSLKSDDIFDTCLNTCQKERSSNVWTNRKDKNKLITIDEDDPMDWCAYCHGTGNRKLDRHLSEFCSPKKSRLLNPKPVCVIDSVEDSEPSTEITLKPKRTGSRKRSIGKSSLKRKRNTGSLRNRKRSRSCNALELGRVN